MKKFEVEIVKRIDYYGTIVVEAEDDVEAEGLAEDLACKDEIRWEDPDISFVTQNIYEVD